MTNDILVSKLSSGDMIIYQPLEMQELLETGGILAHKPFSVMMNTDGNVCLIPFMFSSGNNDIYHINSSSIVSTAIAKDEYRIVYLESIMKSKLQQSFSHTIH